MAPSSEGIRQREKEQDFEDSKIMHHGEAMLRNSEFYYKQSCFEKQSWGLLAGAVSRARAPDLGVVNVSPMLGPEVV